MYCCSLCCYFHWMTHYYYYHCMCVLSLQIFIVGCVHSFHFISLGTWLCLRYSFPLLAVACMCVCVCNLFFGAQKCFSNAEEVYHLCDTKQWCNDDHTAETTFEECLRSFVLQSFSVKNYKDIVITEPRKFCGSINNLRDTIE